jgi:hypothetical protein
MSEIKLTSRPLSKLFNEPEAEIVCNSRRVYRCLEKTINLLENLRLLDFFDMLEYERVLKEDEASAIDFLDSLERKYPIKIVYEDIDP